MKKVNEELLLADYEEILQKQDGKIACIEAEARAFADGRGYDEAKKEEFVKFVLSMENDGLSADEKKLIEILGKYITEVKEEVEVEDAAPAENAEASMF